MPSKVKNPLRREYFYYQDAATDTTSNSPTMTIDNDSFSSTRPHIMGHPGSRIFPVEVYARQQPPQPMHTGFAQLTSARSSISPQRGIAPDHRLHDKLILVETPDSSSAISLVGRLAVVRPDSDDVIVVETKKKTPDATGAQASVEAIYQVIGSRAKAALSSPTASRRIHRAKLYSTGTNERPIAIPRSRISTLRPAHRRMPSSRVVQQQGPLYTETGALAARRPSTLLALTDGAEQQTDRTEPRDGVDVSESFCNDTGYDLVNAEIDSQFCRSFDMDMLPEAPERKVSHYNIGVKDVPRLSPTPSIAEPGNKESPPLALQPAALVEEARGQQRFVHRTLGVVSDDAQFAKP
ncbi:hypothetical protein J3B02_005704, partial [Coemansia erecta]